MFSHILIEILWVWKVYFNTLVLSFQGTSYHFPTLDIDHVRTQSQSASCAMLMRPHKAQADVYGRRLLQQGFTPYTTVALVRMLVALSYPWHALTLSFQVTSHNPTICHHVVEQKILRLRALIELR